MVALIVAACAGWLVAGGLVVVAVKKDNTGEVVEQVAASIDSANAPLLAELGNISTVLDSDRLDKHCTKPTAGTIDAQYLWCLAADCWQQQSAQGQNASETCGKIRDLADSVTRCEMQTTQEMQETCISKLVPR